jgi:hypothetical protein
MAGSELNLTDEMSGRPSAANADHVAPLLTRGRPTGNVSGK